jgi:hypothetical protein
MNALEPFEELARAADSPRFATIAPEGVGSAGGKLAERVCAG